MPALDQSAAPRFLAEQSAGQPAGDLTGRLGVIDIGSNSIRLVVFDRPARALIQVFNEKVLCGLGRGLDTTGRLNPAGVASALENLPRFAAIAAVMGAARIEAFATAAVRDAADGPAFLDEVRRLCGFDVRLLSGTEEARLSALGAVSAIPGAEGVVGDLGGGSLELILVQDGSIGEHGTLPLGPLRLMRNQEKESAVAAAIDRELDRFAWLDRLRGQTLYPVGGTWRAFARAHMTQTGYPLHVIHQYAIPGAEAARLAALLGRIGRKGTRLKGVPKRRQDTLPYGALVLARLLKRLDPSGVVFSAYGLREGVVYTGLPEEEQRRDPLVEACAEMARCGGRFPADGPAALEWMAPLFAKREAGGEAVPERLRLAAAWLADIAGLEHPDYRGEHAFYRVLRAPVVGVDHPGRAFLALALLARYEGGIDAAFAGAARRLLRPEQLDAACVTGLALRLAIGVSAGSSAVLRRSRLELRDGGLLLLVPQNSPGFAGEVVRRRLDALAEAVGAGRAEIRPL